MSLFMRNYILPHSLITTGRKVYLRTNHAENKGCIDIVTNKYIACAMN